MLLLSKSDALNAIAVTAPGTSYASAEAEPR